MITSSVRLAYILYIYFLYIFYIQGYMQVGIKLIKMMSYECEVLYHKVMMDWKRS